MTQLKVVFLGPVHTETKTVVSAKVLYHLSVSSIMFETGSQSGYVRKVIWTPILNFSETTHMLLFKRCYIYGKRFGSENDFVSVDVALQNFLVGICQDGS